MIREAVDSKLLSMAYCLPLASLDDMALCKEETAFVRQASKHWERAHAKMSHLTWCWSPTSLVYPARSGASFSADLRSPLVGSWTPPCTCGSCHVPSASTTFWPAFGLYQRGTFLPAQLVLHHCCWQLPLLRPRRVSGVAPPGTSRTTCLMLFSQQASWRSPI